MARHMTLCSNITAASPFLQAGTFCRPASSANRLPAAQRRSSLLQVPTANSKFLLGKNSKVARSRYTSLLNPACFRTSPLPLPQASTAASDLQRFASLVLKSAASDKVCSRAGLFPAQLSGQMPARSVPVHRSPPLRLQISHRLSPLDCLWLSDTMLHTLMLSSS